MLKKAGDGLQVSVADPTQKLSEINIIITGKYNGKFMETKNGKTKIKIELPQGGEAGKTVTLNLSGI